MYVSVQLRMMCHGTVLKK